MACNAFWGGREIRGGVGGGGKFLLRCQRRLVAAQAISVDSIPIATSFIVW